MTVTACPDCDSSQVYERHGYRHARGRMGSDPWRCAICGWTGLEPVTRPARGATTRSLAYRLREADPEEVSR
jgi:transposase-like protein